MRRLYCRELVKVVMTGGVSVHCWVYMPFLVRRCDFVTIKAFELGRPNFAEHPPSDRPSRRFGLRRQHRNPAFYPASHLWASRGDGPTGPGIVLQIPRDATPAHDHRFAQRPRRYGRRLRQRWCCEEAEAEREQRETSHWPRGARAHWPHRIPTIRGLARSWASSLFSRRWAMSAPKRPAGRKANPEIELHPDAWDRFTEFVKRIAKAGPQHRKPKQRPASRSSKSVRQKT